MKLPLPATASAHSFAPSSIGNPSLPALAQLFRAGATIGPLVDGIHNQSLLRYPVAPIHIPWPSWMHATDVSSSSILPVGVESSITDDTTSWLLASSWLIPPLLGIGYVVLGSLLPRALQWMLDTLAPPKMGTFVIPKVNTIDLGKKAVLAVLSTAAIIKVSDLLVTYPDATQGILSYIPGTAEQHIVALMFLGLVQWTTLDRSLVGLLAASIAAFGGPLSELPFVAQGCWEYLPSVQDYFPLQGLVDTETASHLALSSITGPCYFAVTLDAMALGRFVHAMSLEDSQKTNGIWTALPNDDDDDVNVNTIRD
jgi:hypothetical protein